MRRHTDRLVQWTALLLAGVGIASALLRYLVPPELHVAITEPLFGSYATEQLSVLAEHSLSEHAHRLGGTLYMLLGILQFMPGFRARHPQFHRWSGRIFGLLSLVVGLSGAVMAAFFPFEPGERLPTFVFASLLVYCTARGIFHAMRGQLLAHQEWMTRGFAVGLGIGTIRLIAVALTVGTNIPTRTLVTPAFWAGWGLSLGAAELLIRARRRASHTPEAHRTVIPGGAVILQKRA